MAADTGSIGGTRSHEFQVIADTGEDLLVFNPIRITQPISSWPRRLPAGRARRAGRAPAGSAHPGAAKCEDVAKLLGLPLSRTIKSIVLATDSEKDGVQIWLLLLRGDHELNEIKAGKLPGLKGFRFATEAEIVEHFGCKPGYLGPIRTAKPVHIIADRTVANMADFVCGANREDFHIRGELGRDLPEPELVADLRNVVAGDPRPTARAPWPSSAASRSAMCSSWAPSIPKP